MLKTKRFYKYANKSKSEKRAYLQSQKDKRILRQVKALMADEDDPNPEVHLHSDSEDDVSSTVTSTRTNSGNSTAADINPRVHAATCTVNSSVHVGVNEPQPSTSRAGEEEGEPVGVPKKKRKLPIRKPKNLIPSRQSERALKGGVRVSYSDKIHLKSKKGCGRKPPYSDGQKSVEGTVRIRRIGKYSRRRMIAAMVEMKIKEDKEKKNRKGLEYKENLGGYVSNSDVDSDEVEETADEWVWELPEEQKDSLLHLEKETALPMPEVSQHAGGVSVHAEFSEPSSALGSN